MEITVLVTAFTGALSALAAGLYFWHSGKEKGLQDGERRALEVNQVNRDNGIFDDENGYLGHYSGDNIIIEYMKNNEIKEMWLSGAALLYCIRHIIDGVDKYFKKDDGNECLVLKFILTDITSDLALELYANTQKKGYEDKKVVHDRLIEAYRGLLELIDKLEIYGFEVNWEIYLNPYPMRERIWIMNPHALNGTTFIKIYPDKNFNCNGIYDGGFEFKLRNGEMKGFKFFKEKFENYKDQSVEKKNKEFIKNLCDHKCDIELKYLVEYR